MSKKYNDEEKTSVFGTLGAFALIGVGAAATRAAFIALSEVFDSKVEPQLNKALNKETEQTDKTEE